MEVVFGDYAPGRFEWHFRKITVFPEPIPCKGHQKLWEVQGDAADQLADRLRRAGMEALTADQLALGVPA
jgi:hypothetical protein